MFKKKKQPTEWLNCMKYAHMYDVLTPADGKLLIENKGG